MAIAIPSTYGQVSWDGQMPGSARPWTVTCGFQFLNDDPAAVADYLGGTWAATIKGIQSDDLSFIQTRVVMNVAGSLVGALSGVGAGVGAASGEPGLSNTSVLVRKRTGLVGRRFQGRMFLPGIRESGVSDGANLTVAEKALWTGVVDDLFDALGDGTFLIRPVLLHEETLGTAPTGIVSFDTQTRLATQRRRLRK